jgi:DNA repair protein RadC
MLPSHLDLWMATSQHFHEAVIERIVTVALDRERRIIGTKVVAEGSRVHAQVTIPTLFQFPVCAGADAMLIMHNHPSGDTSPSVPDIDMTLEAIHAGAVLGIHCLDHLIVASGGRSVSLRDRGYVRFGGRT